MEGDPERIGGQAAAGGFPPEQRPEPWALGRKRESRTGQAKAGDNHVDMLPEPDKESQGTPWKGPWTQS